MVFALCLDRLHDIRMFFCCLGFCIICSIDLHGICKVFCCWPWQLLWSFFFQKIFYWWRDPRFYDKDGNFAQGCLISARKWKIISTMCTFQCGNYFAKGCVTFEKPSFENGKCTTRGALSHGTLTRFQKSSILKKFPCIEVYWSRFARPSSTSMPRLVTNG